MRLVPRVAALILATAAILPAQAPAGGRTAVVLRAARVIDADEDHSIGRIGIRIGNDGRARTSRCRVFQKAMALGLQSLDRDENRSGAAATRSLGDVIERKVFWNFSGRCKPAVP